MPKISFILVMSFPRVASTSRPIATRARELAVRRLLSPRWLSALVRAAAGGVERRSCLPLAGSLLYSHSLVYIWPMRCSSRATRHLHRRSS